MASKSTFTKAFSRVASGTFLSRLLGLGREQVFAHLFGATMVADAFFAAFRIPNLLRDLFAEGALSSAFVPVFKRELNSRGKEPAFFLAQICFSLVSLVVGLVVLIGIWLSPALVKLITPGFGEVAGKLELTGQLTAVMFPFLLLVALAALAMSILNSFDRFGVAALSPAMFNIGVIGAAFLICPYLDQPIFGIAIGVLLGGLGQLAIQIPTLLKIGFKFKFRPILKHDGVKEIGKLIAPMIGGLAAGRVNIFVNTVLASMMATGSVSYLTYSYRIMHLPLGMIAVALGTVALPQASQQAAQNDQSGIDRTFYRAIQLCLFLVIPIAAFFITAGDLIVALLFQHGQFVAADTFYTYRALIMFSIGLIGFAGVRVTAPIYYALKDSIRPMRFSIISVVVNLVANFALTPIWGFVGLAAATALGGLVNFGLLLIYLPRHVTSIKLGPVLLIFVKCLLAGTLSGLSVYFARMQPWMVAISDSLVGRLSQLSILIVIATIIYLLLSWSLRNIPSLNDERDRDG